MEPIRSPRTHPQPPDSRTDPLPQLLLALLAIFVLECLIALHTLWPNYPSYLSLLGLWIAVTPWQGSNWDRTMPTTNTSPGASIWYSARARAS